MVADLGKTRHYTGVVKTGSAAGKTGIVNLSL